MLLGAISLTRATKRQVPVVQLHREMLCGDNLIIYRRLDRTGEIE
jgi:hypothetical protein